MKTIPQIESLQADMTQWRRDLHAHPETAFEEDRTAAIVAERTRSNQSRYSARDRNPSGPSLLAARGPCASAKPTGSSG